MKLHVNRRDFIIKGSLAGAGCCSFMLLSKLHAVESFLIPDQEGIPNPKKLNYCGYTCPVDCKFKTGSIQNNIELKKAAYRSWKIKERYGIEFDPDKIFCFGCKTKDQPEGVVLVNCTVRSCAIEKQFDSCIECKNLPECDKDLWTRFPKFAEQVIDIQKKYLAAKKKG